MEQKIGHIKLGWMIYGSINIKGKQEYVKGYILHTRKKHFKRFLIFKNKIDA